MRLAAQTKMGYYPCPPEAVAWAASFLRAPAGASFAVLDPCAGEGMAVGRLADLLGARPDLVYAVELDESRGDRLRAALPQANVLAPASALGCRAAAGSFSLAWVNPPFDDELGGGQRTEDVFLAHVTPWIKPGGVLCLVCPEHVAESYAVRQKLTEWYTNISVRPIPAEVRQYGEVVIFAVRRAQPVAYWQTHRWDVQAPEGLVYDIPAGAAPAEWVKVELTDGELLRALDRSPLMSALAPPTARPLPSPPLSLGRGHVALLLASGHLDGVVQPEGGAAHVVRGTARKETFTQSVSEEENEDGSTTTRTVLSERIKLIVKAVGQDGVVKTYTGE
jgi:hypothetical protein